MRAIRPENAQQFVALTVSALATFPKIARKGLNVQFVCQTAARSFSSAQIVHFTVVCLVAKPLNGSEARDDLVMIQTLLPFKYKSLCYHAN